jgi:hypothetical protein
MSFDPIHRRYGYGAAKIAIGVPLASGRLSEYAQRPSRFERAFSIVPGLLCAAIALLLGTASVLDPAAERIPELAATPTVIDLDPWNPVPPESTSTARPEPKRRIDPKPITLATESTTATPPLPPAVAPEPTPPPFDLRDLAMAPAPGIPQTHDGARPASVTRHRPTASNPGTRSALDVVARSVPAPSPIAVPATQLDRQPGLRAAGRDARPTDSDSGGAPAALEGWDGGTDRDAFLASVSGEAREGAFATQRDRRTDDRPHVAAAGAARERALEIREQVRRQARADGWDEVPLDALPACSPPEREDALKQRILTQTTQRQRRECSHSSGRYRFLETRNLNAFLMWSRPNSASSSSQYTTRDVCDVLERALSCLEVELTEESKNR